jgi:F0F1-type ATP synthase assembly protein I
MLLDPGSREDLKRYMTLAQVGLEIVAPGILGLVLDARFGWGPWGLIIGIVVGFVGGLYHLVILSNREDRPASPPPEKPETPDRREKESGPP